MSTTFIKKDLTMGEFKGVLNINFKKYQDEKDFTIVGFLSLSMKRDVKTIFAWNDATVRKTKEGIVYIREHGKPYRKTVDGVEQWKFSKTYLIPETIKSMVIESLKEQIVK